MNRDRRAAPAREYRKRWKQSGSKLPHSRLDVSRVDLEVVDDVYAVNLKGHNSLVK
jgi:hypothetical protein